MTALLHLLLVAVIASGAAASCDGNTSSSDVCAEGASFIQRSARVANHDLSAKAAKTADISDVVQIQNKETEVAIQNVSTFSYLAGAMGSYLSGKVGDSASLLLPGKHLFITGENLAPLRNKSIWNSSDRWVNFTFWHPAGVVANVYSGQVMWANVNYIDLLALCKLSILAYPFVVIPFALFLAVVVGLNLVKMDGPLDPTEAAGPPAVATSQLSPFSKRLYSSWCTFCCTIPSLLVFGVPLVLVYMSNAWPQEVYSVMLVLSSAFIFTNGVHMAFFSPFVLYKIWKNGRNTASDVLSELKADQKYEMIHWVIFPNYKEDIDIVQASLESVAKSSLACSNICVLLAMEEREGLDVYEKTKHLKEQFADRFKDVLATFHPADLPNDPPGKASNVAHAFRQLSQYLQEGGHDASKVMLTIADADTEFHPVFFETLTRQYFESDPEQRSTYLWQSAILHVKNYHRQPGPVLVGTMFTCMAELSFLSDPNAIRFPYSTYSLTFELAHRVGGWDAEWIAEDWHMGIKCFLFTLGRSQVMPIELATLNYSPEADTWAGTVHARFVQAKRHALGFSDLSYYFMMLPLIFLHLNKVKRDDGANLGDFWRVFFGGLAVIVRLVNTHVILGILSLYAVFDMILKHIMLAMMGRNRGIETLFDRTFFASTMFCVSSVILMSIVTIVFQVIYHIIRDRLEKPRPEWAWMFRGRFTHWLMTALSFFFCGPVFFLGLAYAVWVAALKMLTSRTFEYEVAAKPTKQQRLM